VVAQAASASSEAEMIREPACFIVA
jgi:hypothetical protein